MQIEPVTELPLPFHSADDYHLCLALHHDTTTQLAETLQQQGYKLNGKDHVLWKKVHGDWKSDWDALIPVIDSLNLHNATVSIIPTDSPDTPPTMDSISMGSLPINKVEHMAENLWLIEAMERKRLHCVYQPIMNNNGTLYGYEAYVRIEESDGNVIGGNQIIAASFALDMQHILDRYLQVLSVEQFVQHKLEGKLFINIIPGFIRKAAHYLQRLSDAGTMYGMIQENIILDITGTGDIRMEQHINDIMTYSSSMGISSAADDFASVNEASEFLQQHSPDIIILDTAQLMPLIRTNRHEDIKNLVSEANIKGCKVMAKTVETEEEASILSDLGIHLFRGYYFGKPARPEQFANSK